jgi:regulation of enolase protein 1 (concanavalin A-like superfamily)
LFGSAVDPDHDWMTWEWRDSRGRMIGDVARQCLRTTGPYSGTETFTLTVRDGYGAESTDSMIWTFAVSPPPLPAGWTADVIGDASGRTFPIDNGLSVTGSGADIWHTSDAFQFAHQSVTGNFTITAHVTDVQNIHEWTKAGLMIRGSLEPDSRHAFVLATPTTVNGVAFQRRLLDGNVSIHMPGPPIAPPVWLRLQRQGDVVTGYARSTDAEPWSEVGPQTFVQLPETVFVGLAVTSHEAGRLASATFEQVEIMPASTPPTLPPGWSAVDVGSVSASGGTLHDEGLFALAGSGADIWETRDAFHYAYTPLSGDGVAVVRVLDLEGPHEWAKAGLMIRQSLDPAAVHHYLLMSEAQGLAHQRRPVTGGVSDHTPLDGPAGPVWFRIERTGETIRLWYSTGSSTPGAWHFIADAFFPAGEALIGLAVTSHADGQIATAAFDRVSVTTDGPSAPLTGQDIGAVGVPGHDSFAGGVHSISASGHDIWGYIDAFRYVSRELTGDGTIVARVASLVGPHPWSKAGVMIRSSADPAATHAYMLMSRDHGLAFQRRASSGDYSTHTEGPAVAAPQWVRLTRSGNQVTADYSHDGSTWVTLGSDTVVLGTGPVLVGIAVTSHDNSSLAHATFTDVSVTP